MNKIYIYLVIIFLIVSCGIDSTYVNLNEINEFKLSPVKNTHKVKIIVEGKVDCPCSLVVLSDGKRTNKVLQLQGEIKESYKSDWYEEEMSFMLEPEHCAGEDAKVRISTHN